MTPPPWSAAWRGVRSLSWCSAASRALSRREDRYRDDDAEPRIVVTSASMRIAQSPVRGVTGARLFHGQIGRARFWRSLTGLSLREHGVLRRDGLADQ